MQKNPRVMVFTSSWGKRPYMLRQVIHDVRNQTYKNITHAVNITLNDDTRFQNYLPLFSDLVGEKLVISLNPNMHSHVNNMRAIHSIVNYEQYDLFVKFDDDDIHKSNYVENIVNCFINHPEADITSTFIKNQLNGFKMREGTGRGHDNLGGNPPETDYHMPMTFAFTLKALKSIEKITNLYHYDDYIWRYKWEEDELKHVTVNNSNEVIWHVHGGNWSCPEFLIK